MIRYTLLFLVIAFMFLSGCISTYYVGEEKFSKRDEAIRAFEAQFDEHKNTKSEPYAEALLDKKLVIGLPNLATLKKYIPYRGGDRNTSVAKDRIGDRKSVV